MVDNELHKLLLDVRGVLLNPMANRGRALIDRIDGYITSHNKQPINPNARWIVCACGTVCEIEYEGKAVVAVLHVAFYSGKNNEALPQCTECDRKLDESAFHNSKNLGGY